MKTTIYMIRHAESPFIFGQERTRELSEQGKLDAERVAEYLINVHINAVVSSPYTRAVQTVQGVADTKGLTIQEFEELKERSIKGLDYRISEFKLLEGIKKSFEDKDYCLTGGESTKRAQERAITIIQKLIKGYQGKNVVVGTHGNIMTIIMNYYNEEYGYDFFQNTSKPDIYRLDFEKEKLIEVERVWG